MGSGEDFELDSVGCELECALINVERRGDVKQKGNSPGCYIVHASVVHEQTSRL